MAVLYMGQPAYAIGTSVDLGTAASYSVLAGSAVTNTGPSVLESNVGVSPAAAISGFPPGITGGAEHRADAHALQAQADLTTAYNDAAGQAPDDAAVGGELGGRTLVPGVYAAASSTGITGPLTLDAQGDPNAVFIFQIGSSLTTAASSSVVLLNDAQSCRVFWQIGSSATLGTNTTFVGTIMALTSITANNGATIEGRALARNGAVTLNNNVFTDTSCATTSTTPPTTSVTPTTSVAPTTSVTPTATAAGSATGAPIGTSTASASVTPAGSVPSPTQSANAAAAGAEDFGGDYTGGSLALTGGGPSGPMIGIAVGTVLAGAVLVLVARKRRTI